MAQIKIEWPAPPIDGAEVKFKAPCDCTQGTRLLLCYPDVAGEETSKEFTFHDAHANDLTGLGNLFGAGAYVKVILDTVNGRAYIQNADTNSYLETKITKVKLWENASPSSEFAAQEITVDFVDDYPMYFVKYKHSVATNYYITEIFWRGETGYVYNRMNTTTDNFEMLFVTRSTLISKNGFIRFGDCYGRNVGGSVSVNNTRLVPVQIFGVKGVL